MTILSIVVLILLGLLLLILEFAVIPGVTIAGIGGVAMLIGSVYLAFSSYGIGAGFLTLVAILILAPLIFYRFFNSRAGKKMVLETNIDGKVDTFEAGAIRVGDTGMSSGRLAPSGKARINGLTVEARTTGSFVDQDKPVRVVKVLADKIIVELIKI